jgi:serine/threonine-protein phosphatase PGAM5
MQRRRVLGSLLALGLALLGLCPAYGEAAQSGPSAAFSRTVYLVRHGAYLPDPSADPDLGPGLTPLGIAQARLVAGRLRGMTARFDSLTSSPMTRARETAAVIQETLTEASPSPSAQLAECIPPWEPGGTAPDDQVACARKLDGAFAERFVPASGAESHDVLVAHGNVIRYLVTRALGMDPRQWKSMSVAHASLSVVRIAPDGSMVVLSVGDSGHIPVNLQSWGTDADRQLAVPR